MTKLKDIFTQHKAFISFVVAGDPTFAATVDQVVALADVGCDLVEIGIPFSDPVADGPEIQAADLRAFKQGSTTAKVFELVAQIRERTDVPLAFLTYANIVFKYGYDQFAIDCARLNVGGVIVPDLPLEEQDELQPTLAAHGIDLIPLVAPTSAPERIAAIAKRATGFIYVVSSLGVTGVRQTINTDLADLIAQIRAVTTVPVAIGFGIHSPEQAQQMAQIADGVIVGSAVVHLIASRENVLQKLTDYTHQMRAALDGIEVQEKA